jgi:hypothetical protein
MINGAAIVSMHNPRSPYRICLSYGVSSLKHGAARLLRRLRGNIQPGEEPSKRPALTTYTEDALRRLFITAGLVVEDVVYYDFNVFLGPFSSLLPGLSVAVSRKLERLGRGPLQWIGSGFILKGRKASPADATGGACSS